MKITVEVQNETIIDLIYVHLLAKLGLNAAPTKDKIFIKVKSKQNYRIREWESGELQVTYEGEI